ncbi:protoporphyrinogen/coproporphyrinogen oxidase [Microbacterium sp. HJ5]
MSATPEPFDELLTHAHETRVVVVGGGIGGLVAALECAKVGMQVTVLEESSRFGGTIGAGGIDGTTVGVGATCWSAAGGAVHALVDELGLADRVVEPRARATWIAGLGRTGAGAAPVPADTVLGIPANPWADDVRPFIGLNGAWRAYLDRLRPPLTIGKERNLDRLVRSRMGDAVVDRMVAPLSVGRFGLPPARVDVAAAAPGLSSSLTRTGSLGGAVADHLVGRSSGSAALQSLDGGMPLLVDVLTAKLGELGADLIPDMRVTAVQPADGGGWRLVVDGDPRSADVVFVATGPQDARRLLAPHLGDTVEAVTEAAPRRDIVTLVVDAPGLDSAPRGAEVYAVPGSHRASGLVHDTARWEWLARASGAGRHVVSVAFDASGADGVSALDGFDDAAVAQLARDEASALLGLEIPVAAVRGAHRSSHTLAPPASALGRTAAVAVARDAIGQHRGLAAAGAWIAGSGISRVVADAREEAERVRRQVLWGPSAGE